MAEKTELLNYLDFGKDKDAAIKLQTKALEIEASKEPFDRFVHMGEDLIGKGYFMAEEIQDKVMTLTQRRHQLLETWQRREEIYLWSMDPLLFERDAQVDIHVHADASNLASANAELGSNLLHDIQHMYNR
jgi:hypothetical protein